MTRDSKIPSGAASDANQSTYDDRRANPTPCQCGRLVTRPDKCSLARKCLMDMHPAEPVLGADIVWGDGIATEELRALLAAQESALDAHRAAMPLAPTAADQQLWDATQAAVWALQRAVLAYESA